MFQRVSQDPNYHLFADARTILEIPNFWNVISNLPFLLFGGIGMHIFLIKKVDGITKHETAAYLMFFVGILLTGFGSGYYHLDPSNSTLLWDRLPMTIAFMAFFSIIISEFVDNKLGRRLLTPLLIFGAASVIYWYTTEMAGYGDLRFYALVQFLPLILIPIILMSLKSKSNMNIYIWLIITSYLISKICEVLDFQFYEFGKLLSGHTIKHLFASLAPLLLIIGIKKRKLLQD